MKRTGKYKKDGKEEESSSDDQDCSSSNDDEEEEELPIVEEDNSSEEEQQSEEGSSCEEEMNASDGECHSNLENQEQNFYEPNEFIGDFNSQQGFAMGFYNDDEEPLQDR